MEAKKGPQERDLRENFQNQRPPRRRKSWWSPVLGVAQIREEGKGGYLLGRGGVISRSLRALLQLIWGGRENGVSSLGQSRRVPLTESHITAGPNTNREERHLLWQKNHG